MKHRLNIVHSDDWEAVYIDDKLTYQDYAINPMELLTRIKIEIPGSTKLNDLVVDEWWADADWISKNLIFPESFSDVKLRL